MLLPLVLQERKEARFNDTESSRGVPVDDEIMLRLRNRSDEAALRLLFERYSKLVYSVGLRILHDPHDAEEIVQEVFLYLYEKSHLFDPAKGSAKSWIVQLAFHRALDRKSYSTIRRFYTGTTLDHVAETMSGGANVEEEVGAKLNVEQIRREFAELNERQRATIELFFFEGMEFREIAAKFKEPLGNVRHYYYRGLEKLRRNACIGGLRKTSYELRKQ